MAIVFILIAALGATLLLINKLGLATPLAQGASISEISSRRQLLKEKQLAA